MAVGGRGHCHQEFGSIFLKRKEKRIWKQSYFKKKLICFLLCQSYLGTFYCNAQASLWLWHVSSVVRHLGSVVVVLGLSCPEPCGILVPQPGTEQMFPELEGRFLTTGTPGKSSNRSFTNIFEHEIWSVFLILFLVLPGKASSDSLLELSL